MAEKPADNGQEPQANDDSASVTAGELQIGSLETGKITVGNPAGNDYDSQDDSKNDELPDWARKQLKKANSEAASYRTQLREVQERFKDAKTEAELEEVLKPYKEQLDQFESRNKDLERKLIIQEHGLSADMAEFITGDDPEQWEAQAQKLADLTASNANQFDRERQLRGRNGGQPNREFDAAEKAREFVRERRD